MREKSDVQNKPGVTLLLALLMAAAPAIAQDVAVVVAPDGLELSLEQSLRQELPQWLKMESIPFYTQSQWEALSESQRPGAVIVLGKVLPEATLAGASTRVQVVKHLSLIPKNIPTPGVLCLSPQPAVQMKTLHELLPEIQQVVCLATPGHVERTDYFQTLRQDAERAGLEFHLESFSQRMPSLAEMGEAIRRWSGKAELLWSYPGSPLMETGSLEQLARLCKENRIGLWGTGAGAVRLGCLMAVEPDTEQQLDFLKTVFTKTPLATIGTQPLQCIRPAKTILNVETAEALGLRLNQEKLAAVDVLLPYPLVVRQLLNTYADSFANKDIARFESTFYALPDNNRKSFLRLCDVARDIRLEFSRVQIQQQDERSLQMQAVQSYDFTDIKSGKNVSISANVEFLLEKRDSDWKIVRVEVKKG